MSERNSPKDPGEVVFSAPMWVSRIPTWAPPAILVTLAILTHVPAITADFILDDYLHEAMLEGRFPGERASWDLYNFIDEANRDELAAMGLLPWWTHPGLRIHFFRPLSSALIVVDHAIFGGATLPMHVHSLAWWALVVLGTWWLYRELFPRRMAMLALFAFALAPAHAMPLAWLANRDALLSLAFGIVGLLWLHRFVVAGRLTHLALSVALFVPAFLAGEYALCLGGYVLGMAVVRRDAPLGRRAATLAGFAVPALAYMLVRQALGCGTHGSGFYTDPFDDPTLFALFAPRRLSHLFLNAWLSLGDQTIDWGVPTPLVIGGALVTLVALFFGLRHTLSNLDDPRPVRWLLVGSGLALLPVIAVVPASRLLGAAMLGVAPAAAALMEVAWFRAETIPQRGARELVATLAVLMGFAHLVHAPVVTWLECDHHHRASHDSAALAATMPPLTDDFEHAEIVSLRGMGASSFAPFALRGPMPRSYRVLAETPHVLVLRVDEDAFELVSPREHGLFPRGEGNLYRPLALSSEIGEVYEMPEATLTVTDVEVGIPVSATVVLRPTAGERRLVHQTTEGFMPVPLPPVGFGVTLDSEPAEIEPDRP